MKFGQLPLCVFLIFNFCAGPDASAMMMLQSTERMRADSCASIPDYDCAIANYNRALDFLQSDSTLEEYLYIHNQIGDINYKQGYFSKANESYEKVLVWAQNDNNRRERAKALMGQSHLHWRYGDNVKSINLILESIDLFKSVKDTMNIVSASNILAGIYVSTGEIGKANLIYEETLAIAIAAKDSVGMASSYEYKGVVRFFEDNYIEAIEFYEKSLDINLRIGNELDAGITYGNIGEAYMRLRDYGSALEYFAIAEKIMTKHNFNSGLIFVNYSAGASLKEMGEYKIAHQRFQRSLDLIQLTGENRELHAVLGLIADCYAKEGKYRQAFDAHRRYVVAKDSFDAINQNDQLMQIMSKYEFEKKEQENLYLQKENAIKEKELESKQSVIILQYVIGGILVIFLVLVLYLFTKLYRNKVLLDHSNQAKNKLFGFIAHDIKSPLGNVQMLIHMLEEDLKDNKDQSKILFELSKCAYSVVQLTDDLISWSMAQQEGLDFSAEPVVVGEIVKDSLELYEPQIKFKKLKIENNIEPYIEANVDQKAFLSMIRNVLSNAIKFSELGGVITLSAGEVQSKKTGADMIEIKIADEGVGMTKKKARSIIEGYEIKSTRGTANEKGTGLGLSLVRDFLLRANGYMKIKSKPDEGTKVSLYLPTVD